MKTILINILLLTLFLNSYPQEWHVLNEGFTGRNIDFINENVGWIAGDGKIMKTENGGENWDLYYIDKDCTFRNIDFIDESTGWACSSTNIYKTEDGGRSWFAQGIEYDWSPYTEPLYAVNDTVVYFSINDDDNDEIQILKTVDGGDTWINITPPSHQDRRLNSVWFQDSERGVFIGTVLNEFSSPYEGFILRTYDGGKTWYGKTIFVFSELYDLQMINDSTGYFLGRKDTGNGIYSICKTTNFFNNWNLVYRHPANHYIWSYFYVDDSNLYASLTDSNFTTHFVKSNDGGFTWEKTQNNGWLSNQGQIHFLNENDGIVIIQPDWSCSGFLILQTLDGGQNWHYKHFSYDLYDIQLFNENEGFIHGYQERFYGGSWDYISKISEGRKFQINFDGKLFYFLDDKTGFVLSDEYDYPLSCFKTNDGGINWNQVEIDEVDSPTFHGNDFYFLNDNKGWIVGSGIYETTDNGERWNLIQTLPDTGGNLLSLSSVHGCDTMAFAVGEQGLMVKYTPHNQWQMQPSITDLPLNDVFFSDQQHGWVAGGYLNDQGCQSIILNTANGGQSWNPVHPDKYLINDMYFTDSLHGWCVGVDTTDTGMILETFDGGENWQTVIENLSGLNAIDFKNGVGWAVGDDGLVLRTDNWTTWVDQKTGENYPATYQLLQNYPNPFNPKTVISWQLAVGSHVDLSIYNILGQKVATLVNEQKRAGYHQVELDATNMASGVYLYRLEAEGYVETKKMVLMR